MSMTVYIVLALQVVFMAFTLVVLFALRKQLTTSGGVAGPFAASLEAYGRVQKDEVAHSINAGFVAFNAASEAHAKHQRDLLDMLNKNVRTFSEWAVENGDRHYKATEEKLSELRKEMTQNQVTARKEQSDGLHQMRESIQATMSGIATSLKALTDENNQKLEHMRTTVENRLVSLQRDNSDKLDKMRSTVEEKLHATLELRLGENFKRVSDSLESVHRGLGEMQLLAGGVGDLKRVLTNVKLRGGWAEVQLDALLSEILITGQHERNVAVKPGTQERVDHAVKLPGKDGTHVWLPIDSKFPQEDYQKLLDASEKADADGIIEHGRALEQRILQEAHSIKDKYIEPPYTTDFGILFLPTEGLFAEVMRRPGLHDKLLRDCRVVVTGPTTLAATLSSLRMGFRTLAIEQRSSEVWQVLGAVKLEFTKFGDTLAQVKKKLDQASETIDKANVRTRAMEKKLNDVESLPEAEAARLLGSVDTSNDLHDHLEP